VSSTTAIRNIALKALRRVQSAHKPLVRLSRQRARRGEAREAWREVVAIERELGRLAASSEPIVVGPWLAEVGYEALYWAPFVRWFQDAFRIPPEQLVVVSRGGVRDWYADFAASYVEIFDLMTPAELAARNSERQQGNEGGGRKQTSASRLDEEIVARAREQARVRGGAVCHPSLMFRLFRHVWHGMIPHDYLWTHTRYKPLTMSYPLPPGLPDDFSVAKFYSGTALPSEERWIRDRLRALVAREAAARPVLLLDTGVSVDEHTDYTFSDIPNVLQAREWMTPANNLAVQSALITRARRFLSTCGGLAWLSPMLGTPVVAAYADDRLLGPHLYVAGQIVKRLRLPELLPLDLRAEQRLGA
jgi:hypothetical protein